MEVGLAWFGVGCSQNGDGRIFFGGVVLCGLDEEVNYIFNTETKKVRFFQGFLYFDFLLKNRFSLFSPSYDSFSSQILGTATFIVNR